MGGKHKQAQRTKNNVRPSSSGRSAELLGTNPSSFVGFSTFKDGGYVPALPSFTEDLDSSIHPNFHLVLKKMNKKDATTKLKALNEFASLCRESEAAAVKAVLPFWPRLYCILATDTEHRVREAAHNAHRAVVSSVGRSIAPHLKQIAGAWFTSQYDTYPPASSAATLSFQEAFPPNKLTEAIIFCQEEILNYIYDNLINQTPQTLSNPKISTAEEIEAKYQRVVVSSLHGYAFYLSKLPEEQLKKAEELNKKLISNSKFWKFAKHEVNIVRVAWFTAIFNLCQKASFFLDNEKKHVVTSVFNSLDDSDSVVLPIVWEAALHVMVTVEDWFDFVSIEKLVFPKLWRVLREGGLGSTSSIFPNILPFLSKLPAKLITDKPAFYKRFFSSLQESLKQRNVWISVIESESVAECYVECFGYVVMLHTEELEFCQSLISDQLLSVIEVTLKDSRLHLFRQAFYNKLVGVLVQWSKHKLQESYSQLLNDVINKFEPLFDKLIEDSKVDKQQMQIVLNAQADLLSAFKCQQLQKHNKRLKVTFAEEKDSSISETVTTSAQKSTNYFEETPVQFKSLVYDLVKNLIEKYFNYISSIGTCKHLFISQLAKVVTVFESNDVFMHLTSLSGDEKSWNEFYSNFITVWLKDEDNLIDDVYQLIFTLLKYVENEDEKQFILHSLDQTETKKVLEWCLKNENNSRRSVRQWLLSDKMDSIILSIIDEAIAINSTNNNAESIVKSCLRMKDEDGNIFIKYETVILILNHLLETLMKFENIKDEVDVDILSGLISACLSVFKGHFEEQYNESVINVLLECFKFCLSTDTVCTKLDRTWQDSVMNLALSNNSELVTYLNGKCSKAVKRFINERICLSMKELYHIVRQCVKYLISLQKSESVNSEKFIELFIKEVLSENNNNNEVLNLCYAGEVINSNLSLPSLHIIPENVLKCNLRESFADNIVTKFVTSSLFSVVLLLEMLGIDRNNYMDQDIVCSDDSEDDDTSSDHVLNIDLCDYSTYLSDSILKVAGARVLKDCYSKSKQYFGVRDKINILEKCTKELIQRLGIDGSKDVERELILRGSDSIIGGMCAEGVFILHNDFIGTDNHKNTLETIISENQLTVSQSDMLSLWVPQVFAVRVEVESLCNTKSSLSELAMLCSYLKKQDFKEDSPSLNLYSDWLDKIIKFGKLPTFEVDLSTCSSSDVQLSANAAELLSLVLKKRAEDIAKYSGWDFTMIATASWVATIKKTTSLGLENYCSLEVLQFFCSVLHLFKSLSDYIASCVNVTDAQIVTEWNDVFVADVHRTLIDVWVNVAGNCQSAKNIQPEMLIVLNELSIVVDKYIDTKLFIDNTNIDHWLEVSCRYLQSSVADIQFTAYTLIMKLTPHLVVSNSETEEECRVKVTMKQIEDTVKTIQTIVDAMLDEFKLGDTCIVQPFTDGYVYARGYLFLWLAILDLCDKADPQLRFAYTSWIKESCFLGYLMKTLLCLMPEQAVHGHEGNVKHVQELFSNPPEISTGFCESKALAHLSCWTYYKLLGRLPAEVRQWWSEIDHKVGTIVERLTSTFVSPLLCANEMKAVRLEGKNIQNMTVHVHTASREVIAVYVVEESSTELVIQLPINHPLGPTKVESGKCMVSTNQTRQWIMQLSLFLTHQNGSIWDALSLWKNLIDKKFEGVEECYICFAILHNVTQQLPKLTCQTCKKKFHNTCLYRWFTTSNKSTCPICRNLF